MEILINMSNTEDYESLKVEVCNLEAKVEELEDTIEEQEIEIAHLTDDLEEYRDTDNSYEDVGEFLDDLFLTSRMYNLGRLDGSFDIEVFFRDIENTLISKRKG